MFQIRLKKLREATGLSQYSFAKQFGVAQSTVGSWEAGKREPNFATAQRLADFFNVSVDYLLGRTDEKSPAPQEPSASLAYSPLEQEIIKAYRAAPPVLQEAVLNVLHIPIPASNVRQKKNA